MTFRIAAAEFRYQILSLQSLVSFAVFFGIGFLLTANAGEFQSFSQGGLVWANAPHAITDTLIKLSLAAVFAVPPYIAGAVLRDVDSGYDAIVFATPIRKREYLNGRFMGGFAAFALVIAGAPLGLLSGSLMPWVDPQLIGPARPDHYIAAFAVIVVPTLLFISAIAYAAAAVSRSLIFTYVALMILLMLYLVTGENSTITPLADPFMYDVFEKVTRYWSANERNTQMIALDGMVLQSRLLWLAMAAIVYGFGYTLYSFRNPSRSGSRFRKSGQLDQGDEVNVEKRPESLNIAPEWSRATAARQFLAQTRFELSAVLKTMPFVLMLLVSVVILFFSLSDREVHYGVQALPVTRLMVESLTTLNLAMLVMLAFYSADVIWRERGSRINDIIDAMPVPNWVFVMSKLSALIAIVLIILGTGIIMAIVLQLIEGYHRLQPGLYLEQGLLFPVLPFLSLAALTVLFQVLVRNRYLGMMLFILFLAALISSRDLFGVDHPLLSFGFPVVPAPLSDMNDTGQFMALGYSVRIYWLAIAGLMVMATYLLWNRGLMQPLRFRMRQLKRLKSARFAIPTLVLLLMVTGSAGYVYYNTNVLNPYMTETDIDQVLVDYERSYRHFETLPMPTIISVDIDVDLFPYQRRVEARSVQILENKTSREINEVHVVFPVSMTDPVATLSGATLRPRDDSLIPYLIFDLDQPMAPGDRGELRFETGIELEGFTHVSPSTELVDNGSFIHNEHIAPNIGFQPDFMLEDNVKRAQYDLPPLPQRPRLEDSSQYHTNVSRQDSDFITFETTVSTVADQIAVSQGDLVSEWLEDDRRYFHYRMNAPMRNFYSYVSAEFDVMTEHWNGVDIEIYHHPEHDTNLNRMMQAVKDSLDVYGEVFSPYQYNQLRIVEFPAYRKFAQSFATTIPYSEDIGFLDDVREGDPDMPYYVTAHEVAHQWWGHQLTAANVQGADFIHETLAQYSALMLMQRRYGETVARRFLAYELDRYLSARAGDPAGEQPLYRVGKQQHIYYRKGSVIMYALADYLGAETVNRSLARLLELRAYSDAPYTISTDFITILREEAGSEYDDLITDFFERITLYDLGIDHAGYTRLDDGRYRISLELAAAMYQVDVNGEMDQGPVAIPVEIGLFGADPATSSFSPDDVIVLEKRQLYEAGGQIELIVDKLPTHAGIDPYHKLIDRNAEDNVRRLVEIRQIAADSSP